MNSDREPSTAPAVARLVLAYDGGAFHGWQVQPGLRTVQGVLAAALDRLVPLDGLPPGAGRTDAGVHARGQVSSVPLHDPDLIQRMGRSLPRMFPDDMALVDIGLENGDFHARFSARGRRYSYRILLGNDPFRRLDHWMIRSDLNVDAMRSASQHLLGPHDYDSFCRTSSLEEGKTLCEVRRVSLEQRDDAIVFTIEADRFLHSMVRSIVGTLVEIGRGQRDPRVIPSILAARDRAAAGRTAPPQGLSLDHVKYSTASKEGN